MMKNDSILYLLYYASRHGLIGKKAGAIVRFSLRKKMFRMMLLVAVIIFVHAVFSILAVLYQSGLTIYDEKISNLKTSASLIEQNLKTIEEVSFRIFRDDNLQYSFSQIEDQAVTDKYQLNKLKTAIVEDAMPYLTQMNSIIGISFYDSSGEPLTSYQTDDGIQIPPDDLATQYHFPQDGTPAWSTNGGYLVLSRNIRRINNLVLDVIGKMCIYIDVVAFENELYFQSLDKALYVLDADKHFLTENMPEWLSTFDYSSNSKFIQYSYQNQYYLIFYHHSKTTQMTYVDVMNVTPQVAKVFLLLVIPCSVLLLIVMGMMIISSRWSSRILRPLYALINDISTSDHWDPKHFEQEHQSYRDNDDLSRLNAHILEMLRHIDALNKKDYHNKRALDLSQYQALQAQIEPHFLYNTLDAMNWIAKENQQDQLVNMLEALADYLRYITNFQETMIPIEKELDAIEKYISIEKYRFEDMLQIEYYIDRDACCEIIPKMTIQPLIENSIKHRHMKIIQPCVIKISVRRLKDIVRIAIEDNGPGFDSAILEAPEAGKAGGIGLHNISKRLIQAFGESAAIQIVSPLEDRHGARVYFSIPVQGRKERLP